MVLPPTQEDLDVRHVFQWVRHPFLDVLLEVLHLAFPEGTPTPMTHHRRTLKKRVAQFDFLLSGLFLELLDVFLVHYFH